MFDRFTAFLIIVCAVIAYVDFAMGKKKRQAVHTTLAAWRDHLASVPLFQLPKAEAQFALKPLSFVAGSHFIGWGHRLQLARHRRTARKSGIILGLYWHFVALSPSLLCCVITPGLVLGFWMFQIHFAAGRPPADLFPFGWLQSATWATSFLTFCSVAGLGLLSQYHLTRVGLAQTRKGRPAGYIILAVLILGLPFAFALGPAFHDFLRSSFSLPGGVYQAIIKNDFGIIRERFVEIFEDGRTTLTNFTISVKLGLTFWPLGSDGDALEPLAVLKAISTFVWIRLLALGMFVAAWLIAPITYRLAFINLRALLELDKPALTTFAVGISAAAKALQEAWKAL